MTGKYMHSISYSWNSGALLRRKSVSDETHKLQISLLLKLDLDTKSMNTNTISSIFHRSTTSLFNTGPSMCTYMTYCLT
jgi:hypothetical protein